ncbi:MAG: type II toxin-antitoxin system PemK/MazF family toxin [Chloroflexota bacterium]|nr:MAG: type II toxin-antitoxin system PemK/MazF family toxin [Chloroflexota bacterium]
MKRGEVYWYDFNHPDKRRPVLILTRSVIIPYLNTVTIAPITTRIRDIPSEVLLTIEDGMSTNCVANFDNIQTVSQAKIGEFITYLSPRRLEEVKTAVSFALGLDEFSW